MLNVQPFYTLFEFFLDYWTKICLLIMLSFNASKILRIRNSCANKEDSAFFLRKILYQFNLERTSLQDIPILPFPFNIDVFVNRLVMFLITSIVFSVGQHCMSVLPRPIYEIYRDLHMQVNLLIKTKIFT